MPKNCVFLPFDRPSGCLRFPMRFHQAAEKKTNSLFRVHVKRRAKFNLGASSGFHGRSHTLTQGRPHRGSGIKSANVQVRLLMNLMLLRCCFQIGSEIPAITGPPPPTLRPPASPVPRRPALGRGLTMAAAVNSLSAVKDFS